MIKENPYAENVVKKLVYEGDDYMRFVRVSKVGQFDVLDMWDEENKTGDILRSWDMYIPVGSMQKIADAITEYIDKK